MSLSQMPCRLNVACDIYVRKFNDGGRSWNSKIIAEQHRGPPVGARYPPICVDLLLMLILTWTAQEWGFCALLMN
jgi:hypothetical protein